MDPNRVRRWALSALGVLLLALFAFLNAGERVSLNLGVAVLYRIPLVGMFFGAFILGMVTMFGFGLRHDRRVRELLREHGLLDRPPPPRWDEIPPPPEPPA